MNKLFIEIYLDENVRVLIAKILRSHGFKASTTHEVERKGTSDSEQLKYASENGCAILTLNRTDFEELAKEYFDAGEYHYGIIYRRRQFAARNCPSLDYYFERLHGGRNDESNYLYLK